MKIHNIAEGKETRMWAYGRWVNRRRHAARRKAKQNNIKPPERLVITVQDRREARSLRYMLGITSRGLPGWETP